MKITIAKTAGFCMGVRRAVELALDASNQKDGSIYTYGPLIHNPQVLNILEEKGISVIRKIPETKIVQHLDNVTVVFKARSIQKQVCVPGIGFPGLVSQVIGRRALSDEGRPINYTLVSCLFSQQLIPDKILNARNALSGSFYLGAEGQVQIKCNQVAITIGEKYERQ